MKRFALLLTLLPFAGCAGVSKEIWLNEVAKRENMEKQASICGAQLRSGERREESLRKDLTDADERQAAVKADLEKARAQAADIQTRLTASVGAEQGTRADLENCQRERAETGQERDRLRATAEQEASARAEDKGKCGEVGSDRDRLRRELDAEKSARAQEMSQGAQVAADRDRLRRELEAEKAARTEEKAGAGELTAEGDRLRKALDAEKAARAEEKVGAGDLTAERDRLRQELEGERRGRSEESGALRARVTDLEGQAAALAQEKQRTEQEKVAKVDEVSKGYEELLKGMKSELDKGQVTISELKGRLTVNVMDEILFSSGSAKVNPKGNDVLGRVGQILKGMDDKAIVIEGHTDSVPLRGELAKVFPTNWELSAARATSVVRYLQDAVGIDPRRLSAVGFGPNRPMDANDTPEGRSRNRRIEIKLVPLDAPLLAPAPREAPAARP